MMIKTVVGACAVLLITLLGGWLWGAGGNTDIGREIRAIDTAQRLLGQLDPGASALVP
jgi:hypothetical protein